MNLPSRRSVCRRSTRVPLAVNNAKQLIEMARLIDVPRLREVRRRR
jgi:hypothetical protein